MLRLPVLWRPHQTKCGWQQQGKLLHDAFFPVCCGHQELVQLIVCSTLSFGLKAVENALCGLLMWPLDFQKQSPFQSPNPSVQPSLKAPVLTKGTD